MRADKPLCAKQGCLEKSGHTDDVQRSSNIGAVLREATELLAALPQASPYLEARLLLSAATGRMHTEFLARPETELSATDLAHFDRLLRRRLAGEPIAYIRGRQAFWTLDLRVTPATLIPRPETELLVELALAGLPAKAPLRVLDAGSGSGAIAAALASERPAWTLLATEHNPEAARLADINLRTYRLGNAHVIRCDWLQPIARGSLDAIVGNPPYLSTTAPHLGQGDLSWEPRPALTAGPDGLDAIRTLCAQATSRLRPTGFIALEHGYDQGLAARAIFERHGFEDILTHRDLGDRERATTGRLPPRRDA